MVPLEALFVVGTTAFLDQSYFPFEEKDSGFEFVVACFVGKNLAAAAYLYVVATVQAEIGAVTSTVVVTVLAPEVVAHLSIKKMHSGTAAELNLWFVAS